MADLQSLLDDLVMAAAEVTGPWPVAGPEPMDSALAQADSLARLQGSALNLAKALDTMPRGHVANFREGSWVLEHPLSCRVVGKPLSDCPYNAMAFPGDEAPQVGRYEVELVNGMIVVGSPVFVHGHSRDLLATLDGSIDTEEVRDGGGQQDRGEAEDVEHGEVEHGEDGEAGHER